MAKPTIADLVRLKRLARYLQKYPRVAYMYPHHAPNNKLRIFSDTDWAGCIKTRKSTQGGVAMLGECCVKSWSSTQSLIALSSGEAEYYGVVKGSSSGLGLQSLCKDLGFPVELEVLTDATAAKGIASRKGLSSKTRHIQVHYLWLQDKVAHNDFKLSKVWGQDNPADLLTKYLTRDKIDHAMKLFGLHILEGRSAEAPLLTSDVTVCGLLHALSLVRDFPSWDHHLKHR